MEKVSQSWVLELLKELRSQTKQTLGIAENESSPMGMVTFEMPSSIWIFEESNPEGSIFEFNPDKKTPCFKCNLKKYPSLRELLARHCPTPDYQITDPWEIERQREEKIAKLKARRAILAKKHDEIATAHDRLVDEIHALGGSL